MLSSTPTAEFCQPICHAYCCQMLPRGLRHPLVALRWQMAHATSPLPSFPLNSLTIGWLLSSKTWP